MELNPPVQFPSIVHGKQLIASVTADLTNEEQTIFHVQFSDGYEDDFICHDNRLVEGTKKEASKDYAKAIRPDLYNVVNLDPEQFYSIFQETIDGVPVNVWVIAEYDPDELLTYRVFYNEFFRFDLYRKENAWQLGNQALKAKNINEGLIRKVGFLLDSLDRT